MVRFSIPLHFRSGKTDISQRVDVVIDMSAKEISDAVQCIGRFYGSKNIEYDSIPLATKINDMLSYIEHTVSTINKSGALATFDLKEILSNLSSFSHFAHYTPMLKQILQHIVTDVDQPNVEYIVMRCQKCMTFVKQRFGQSIQRIKNDCMQCQIVFIQENFMSLVNVIEHGWGHFAFAIHVKIILIYIICHSVDQDINDTDSLMRKLIFHWILCTLKNILNDVSSLQFWDHNSKKMSKYMSKFTKALESCKINMNPKMFLQFANSKSTHPASIALKQSMVDICGNFKKRSNFDDLANLLFCGLFLRLMLESWKNSQKVNMDCKEIEICLFLHRLNLAHDKQTTVCSELRQIREFLSEEWSKNYLLDERSFTDFILRNQITEIFTHVLHKK
ncbi:unkown [Neodiprion lecontei nucleopolyhedrovirus]|uniref:Unkown n=1 Tax=Neodiprion lecontei nucleopolyhedrovirus (strain Canada) TaxID=654906 RepID=Q6JPD7_NPVNC|nr:unkown [Neodiprion lecontei nucleopolyhedrovirus]AAQ99075.1 unkown [Neodiprion lecontei nucleopolyhedrovirus]